MKFIVGLGNPGLKYRSNRHNIGFMMIDYIVNQVQSSKVKVEKKSDSIIYHLSSNILLVKPQTFMNLSGPAVKKLISQFPNFSVSDLIVVHDDLDIPLGKFKIQKATGPQLHNGIDSIEHALGTKDFWRVRIGVDNRLKTGYVDGESYVLQDFRPQEKTMINATFPKVYQRLQTDFLLKL